MAKQSINIGTENGGDGDNYRLAFDKAKQNFDQLFDAVNITGTATFTQPATWVASPTSPVTSTIVLSTAGAVSGAVACVYFKGTALAFSGGTVVVQSGNIVVDELCLVWIIYDKESNSFHANIQIGFNGGLPVPEVGPAKMTITGISDIVGGDVTPPAKMTITNLQDESIDVTPPATMIITNIL